MNDTINAEVVLREIAEVLKRHSIPFNTFFVEVSLLDDDFDQTFPQLKDYKSGVFYRPLSIDNTPATFRAKRRIPFDEIVEWLRINTLPVMKKITAKIEQDFHDISTDFHVSHQIDNSLIPDKYSYGINILCRLKNEPKIESGNTVNLSIEVQQHDATSYPKIESYVAWFVDEESGGDFGLDVVLRGTFGRQEVSTRVLEQANQTLQDSLEECFRQEIKKLYRNSSKSSSITDPMGSS